MPTDPDPRTPQQRFEDLFRPPATEVVLFMGQIYELDQEHPLRSRRLPPGEERGKLGELK